MPLNSSSPPWRCTMRTWQELMGQSGLQEEKESSSRAMLRNISSRVVAMHFGLGRALKILGALLQPYHTKVGYFALKNQYLGLYFTSHLCLAVSFSQIMPDEIR